MGWIVAIAGPLTPLVPTVERVTVLLVAFAVGRRALWRLRSDGWPARAGSVSRVARRARFGWRRLARDSGLVLVEQHDPAGLLHRRPVPAVVVYPQLRVRVDRYGIVALAQTLPGVGLERYQKATDHLANAWGVPRVEASQGGPGWVQLRGLLSDPLLERHVRPSVERPDGLYLGRDEMLEDVWLDLPGLSGIKVGGLPGYGKTLLVMGLAAQLAIHPGVQVVVLDGKTSDPANGDWGELLPRVAAASGDDPVEANGILRALVDELKQRPGRLRATTGSNRFWKHGPTPEVPLIVLIVDESHNYSDVSGLRGPAKETVEQNQRLLRTLVKEGRGTGLLPILLTQKQTADAIPTAARDNLEVGICFATTTIEAAEATLGRGIRDTPEAWPIQLVDKQRYVGVCVATGLPGRSGYVRLRVPDLDAEELADIARQTAPYRRAITPAPAVQEPESGGGAQRPGRRSPRKEPA